MKMIWRTLKHRNRRKRWIIRWFCWVGFFWTARDQNIVYWTYVKLKCTKVVNIFIAALPCIPNATQSVSLEPEAQGNGRTAATLLLLLNSRERLVMLRNTYGFLRAHLLWQLTEVVCFKSVLRTSPRGTSPYSAEESYPGAGSLPQPDQFGEELVPCSTSFQGFILETAAHENHFNLLYKILQLDSWFSFRSPSVTFFTKFSTKNITSSTFASLLQFKAAIIIWHASGFPMPLVPSTVHWIVW